MWRLGLLLLCASATSDAEVQRSVFHTARHDVAHDSVINLGTKFVFAFTNSHINPNDTTSTELLTVIVTNPNPVAAEVSISSIRSGWTAPPKQTVPAKSSVTIEISPSDMQTGFGFQKPVGVVVEDKGLFLEASAPVSDKGLFLEASAPVSVLTENQHTDGGSSDMFTVFPVCNLGTQYKAVGDLALSEKTNLYTIVATEDDTHVTFAHRGATVTKKLKRLQTVTFLSVDIPTTNNPISADKTIAVISGAVCGFGYLQVKSPCNEEALMLLPVGAWGRTYPFAPFFGQPKSEVVSLPWENGTVVSFGDSSETLQNASYRVWKTESALFEASAPVDMVAVGGTTRPDYMGAPFFTHVPAVEQFLEGSVTVHTGIALHAQSAPTHFVRVIQHLWDLDSVSIDGWPISGLIYTRIGRTDYFYVDYPVEKGKHTVVGSKKFGCLVYGYGEFVGYAYVPGLHLPSSGTC
uniref:IgGFc_binding domain-containing protein n=1 Tax=Steinernema glaseri TaxID=37863 RepID=A0A1I7ZIM8_9BILA